MANELTIGASLSFTKGDSSLSVARGGLRVDVAGNKFIHNIQNINTSEEAIVLGDAGAGGYVFLENMDSTNYVEIRPATGGGQALIRLLAGEIAMFRLAPGATAPFAQANTATVNLRVVIVQL